MAELPIIPAPVRRWECEHCNCKSITHEPRVHSQMHTCSGLGGLTAPMVLEGSGVRVVAHEREDYIGSEDVRLDDAGRPIASISTEYPDGRNDLVVFAPTASTSANA